MPTVSLRSSTLGERGRLLAGEGQQLAGEIGGPFRRFADLQQGEVHRMVRSDMHDRHLCMADDHTQHVVEVVRHSSRQPADGFHFLRLEQLSLELRLFRFRPLALRNVPKIPYSTELVAVADDWAGEPFEDPAVLKADLVEALAGTVVEVANQGEETVRIFQLFQDEGQRPFVIPLVDEIRGNPPHGGELGVGRSHFPILVHDQNPVGRGVEGGPQHVFTLAQGRCRLLLLLDGPGQFQVAERELGNQYGQLRQEPHEGIDLPAAVARHTPEGLQIRFPVKPVPVRLLYEDLFIHDLVIVEELARIDIAHMLRIDVQGGRHVPEMILALVGHELALPQIPGQEQIAFRAVHGCLRMDTVKTGTDVLPADGYQDVSFEVQNRQDHMGKGIKVVHEGLEGGDIDNLTQGWNGVVGFGQTSRFSLCTGCLLAFPPRQGSLQGGNPLARLVQFPDKPFLIRLIVSHIPPPLPERRVIAHEIPQNHTPTIARAPPPYAHNCLMAMGGRSSFRYIRF